ncbi:hypothetical protein GGR56DRAFT_633394 [Xylariaceae sp. FL0804]|nr:hypothetical protein GGR56DRAFT_633394 [Xylariaceae sp. FL0804]
MTPEIPGYYYDTSKGRYFKIEKTGTAPRQAAWSSDNVKKRRLEDDEAAATQRHRNLTKSRITRSKALSNPLMGGFLARECGDEIRDVPAASFARGLLEKGQLPLADARWRSNANVKHMYIGNQDHKTGLCTAYATVDEFTLISTYLPRDRQGRMHRRLLADYMLPSSHISPCPELVLSQISDIKYHKSSNQILATSRAAGRGITICAFSPTVTEPEDRRPHWLLGWSGDTVYTNLKAAGDARYSDHQANAIAPAPAGSSRICAVGTSRGIATWDEDGYLRWRRGTVTTEEDEQQPSFRDIFALDFQHRRPDLLTFGGRPGKMFTGDLRVRTDKWDHLQLPGPITHLRSLNEHQTLAAGLHDQLSVYDLRFAPRRGREPPPPPPSERARQERRRRQQQQPSPISLRNARTSMTAPLLTFPGYSNAAHLSIGLDVDADAGVVAAAHDDGRVALYSLRSGRRLRCPAVDDANSLGSTTTGPIRSVQLQSWPGDATPTLFVGVRSNIQAYSFGVEDLGDEA